jgi:hypothetical protein
VLLLLLLLLLLQRWHGDAHVPAGGSRIAGGCRHCSRRCCCCC